MAQKAIVGEKVGMTQVWDDQNRAVPVTVVRVSPCRIVQVKTPEHDGYSALQVTFGVVKTSRLTRGQFPYSPVTLAKAGVHVLRLTKEAMDTRAPAGWAWPGAAGPGHDNEEETRPFLLPPPP